jgi:hypothetical protein
VQATVVDPVPCEILKLRNERQRNKFEAAIARQIGS